MAKRKGQNARIDGLNHIVYTFAITKWGSYLHFGKFNLNIWKVERQLHFNIWTKCILDLQSLNCCIAVNNCSVTKFPVRIPGEMLMVFEETTLKTHKLGAYAVHVVIWIMFFLQTRKC